jgi:hypothetical protein
MGAIRENARRAVRHSLRCFNHLRRARLIKIIRASRHLRGDALSAAAGLRLAPIWFVWPKGAAGAGCQNRLMPRRPERPVRDLADAYVASLADLDPMLATMLGVESSAQGVPDLSPAGYEAQDELAYTTLAS